VSVANEGLRSHAVKRQKSPALAAQVFSFVAPLRCAPACGSKVLILSFVLDGTTESHALTLVVISQMVDERRFIT